jgi:hypothetical protein
MHINASNHEGEEKNNGIHVKKAPGPDSTLRLKPDTSVLQQLLAASKDAEVLIACLFEQHFITAAPLQQIWSRLAAAIDDAQRTVQAGHMDDPSAPSGRRFRQRRP